ncbi:MAG: hypothetical protein IKM43_01695 [Clostridia bacterium]|nr:hypothetical protein [Clostridia bacterium]
MNTINTIQKAYQNLKKDKNNGIISKEEAKDKAQELYINLQKSMNKCSEEWPPFLFDVCFSLLQDLHTFISETHIEFGPTQNL